MRLAELYGKNEPEIASYLALEGKERILEKFAALGLPTKKSEAYRYFDPKALFESPYKRTEFVPKEPPVAETLEITDGVVTKAPKGVRVYYEDADPKTWNHFDPLYYLGFLLAPKVIKVEIDGDIDVELVHHITQSDTLIAYRIDLCNQEGRHATLFERFTHEDDVKGSLLLWGYDVSVKPKSSLRIIKTQTIDENAYAMVASHHFHLQKEAHMALRTFDMGGADALTLFEATLEEHAELEAGHLLYLNSSAKRGTVSQIIHKGQHSISNQEAKNIIESDARGIFDALIKVESGAKYTKAHQNSKAILLSDKAYMAAKPQLEIYIDELEASHGSTTGQLDKKALFYLRSRGVDKVEARKMLVLAFANTLIERVKDARHQERIKEEFEVIFYKTNAKNDSVCAT